MKGDLPQGNTMNAGSSVLHGASSNQIPGAQFNTSEGITINIQQGVQRHLDESVDSSSVLHQGQWNFRSDRTLNHTIIESQEPNIRQDEECTEELSAHAIYERQLLPQKHGSPLWIPQPNTLAYLSHRRKGVIIGDLGRVTRSGAFDVLLNICKPAGPPNNPDELPDGFEPLILKANDIHRFQEFTSGSYIASASVNKLRNPITGHPSTDQLGSGLMFRCSRSEGAVLTMPDGAFCENLRNLTLFRDFAAENAESWYRFINGPCGWELGNGELRLVTGCDKTISWGLAAYNNIQSQSDSSDTLRGEPLLTFRSTGDVDRHISRARYCWEHEGTVQVKTGPEFEVGEEMLSNGTRARNQCTFVRLHTIKLSEAEWARVQSTLVSALDARRASKDAQPKSKNYFSFLMDAFSSLGVFSPHRSTESATMTESHIRSPAIHPSTFIANKLLEEHPHAKVAIVHDGDWGAVIGENEDEMPTGTELWKRVQETFDIVLDSKGTIYLSERSAATHHPPKFSNEKPGLPGVLQASAAQPLNGQGLRRQVGISTKSTKSLGQQCGSAEPPDNEEVANSTLNFILFAAMGVSVAAVSVAVVLRLVITPTDRKIPPSNSPPSLPPVFSIYGRDEFMQEAIDKILQQSKVKKHLVVRGGPGMGKTAIATGIIHHPRIAQHFGNARHWVNCREASDIPDDLKAPKLLQYISDSLDLDLTASSDRRKSIKYFLDNNDVPRIIVLDNFETMWEPPSAREASEGVLTSLAQFTQVTILLTTRNAYHPAADRGLSWHQFEPVQPLSLDASRMLFTSLSPIESIDSRLDDLLRAVDRIPLPVVLMASMAQENYMTSEILEIWNSGLSKPNETQPHKDDGDPMNKLDRSIALSLESPLIKSTPEAPVLLRVLAALPNGIGRKNLQRIVPSIHGVDRVAAVLIRTSLLTGSPDALQMHSTIRSYMLRNYALDASHKENIQAFFFQLIHEAGDDPGTQEFLERARSLSDEETNAETLLLDGLEHNFSLSISTTMDYFNYRIWNIPRLDVPKKTLDLIRNQPLGGADSWLPLALLRLGTLHFTLDNYPEATEALQEAVYLYEKLDQLSWAAQAWFLLAEIARLRGERARALQLYSEAYKQFEDMGDARRMSACLRGKGLLYFQDGHSSEALETITKAQKTCLPDDHTCIADCERELGTVYRYQNLTASIALSTKARDYYLIHGPRRHATIAFYEKSIALYLQGDYDEAELGLSEAIGEFRSLRSGTQMAYSVYHLAEINRMRGSCHQALVLYRHSESIFEHLGNEVMVGLSLKGQVELYANLCQVEKARQAYSSARALLDNLGARDATATNGIRNMHDMCELARWRDTTFKLLPLFLACVVLCSLLIHRRWPRQRKNQFQARSLEAGTRIARIVVGMS